MKRKLFFIFLAFVMLGTIAYLYFTNIFLPVKLRQIILTKAQETLHRKVSFSEIDFKPIKGFTIHDVKIYEKDNPDDLFLKVDDINFNIILTAFWKNKTVIIPTLRIHGPFISLIRQDQGTWNFSDLIPSPQKPGPTAKKDTFNLFARKIVLTDGEVNFHDRTKSEEFFETLKNINAGAVLSLNKSVNFDLKAAIPERQSQISLNGNFDINTKKINTHASLGHFYLARYLNLFYKNPKISLTDELIVSSDANITFLDKNFKLQGSLNLESLDITLEDQTKINGNIKLDQADINWQNNQLQAKGNISAPNFHATTQANQEIQGAITLQLNTLNLSEDTLSAQGRLTIDKAQIKPSADSSIQGNLNLTNAVFNKRGADIQLQGGANLDGAFIKIGNDKSLAGDISAQKINLTYKNAGLDLQADIAIDNTQLTLGADRRVTGDIKTDNFSVSLQDNVLKLQSLLKIDDAKIQIDPKIQFLGSPSLKISYAQNLQDPSSANYTGTINLEKSTLQRIPFVNTVSDINGKISFKPDFLQTQQLNFRTLDTGFQVSGSLNNFADPSIDIQATSSEIDLEKAIGLFPEQAKKLNLTATGRSTFKGSFKGNLKKPLEADMSVTAQLIEATLSGEKFPGPVSNISGDLSVARDLLSWKNLQGTFQGAQYKINGQLKNFSLPLVDTIVESDKFSLTTQIKVLNNAFQILSLNGKYQGILFDIKGDVKLVENEEPNLDLRLKLDFDLKDLAMAAPPLKDTFEKFNLQGTISAEGLFRGKAHDWRNWQLSVKAQSPKIIFMNHPLEDVVLQMTQRDRHIDQCDLSAKVYEGLLTLTSYIDLLKDDLPGNVVLKLDAVNLERLREAQKIKSEISGKLTLGADLTGPFKNPDQLKGGGNLTLTEGKLWELNLVKGIFGALTVIPEFKDISFTDAQANFAIQNQRISTDNAVVKGNVASLIGKGWIDFKGNINMDVTPTFSEITILQSESLKKGLTSLLGKAVMITVTGTLEKPQYKVQTSPLKLITNILGTITEGF